MDPPPYPGAPKWVKVSLAVLGTVLLGAILLLHLAGGGPLRHLHGRVGAGAPHPAPAHRASPNPEPPAAVRRSR
jgi:hypothetical protein